MSGSHEVGIDSANPVIEMRWTPVAGAQGYSVSWTGASGSLPDTTADLPGDASTAASPPLDPGRWWFHLRTQGPGGDWTSTVHVGPFPIVTAGAAPEIRALRVSPTEIAEVGTGSCAGWPAAAQVSATGVSDPDGSVVEVRLAWAIDDTRTGDVPMSLTGQAATTSLSFPANSITPEESPATISITVTAVDDDGLRATRTTTLRLVDCP